MGFCQQIQHTGGHDRQQIHKEAPPRANRGGAAAEESQERFQEAARRMTSVARWLTNACGLACTPARLRYGHGQLYMYVRFWVSTQAFQRRAAHNLEELLSCDLLFAREETKP